MGARRLVLFVGALATVCALVVTGCGSSSSSTSVPGPLATELSYLPADSPFVLTVKTDPNSSAVQGVQDLIGRFPLAGFGIQALQSKLTQLGIDYSSEIKPLLGNPIALSFAGAFPSTSSSNPPLVAAWVTNSQSGLQALLKKALPGVSSVGTRDGATLYQVGSTQLAVDGATLVIGTQGQLAPALDRHAHGGGFSTSAYTTYTSSLPQDALITAFGSLGGVLSQPSAATAKKVPWVAAIRGYGVGISASSSGLSIHFRVATSGNNLQSNQLPIASGDAPPAPAGPAPIEVAIRDPSQIVTFVESAVRAVDPAGYQHFLGNAASLKAATGVDLTSLAQLLNGNMSIASNTHITAVRVGVSDPAQATKALDALAHAPPSIVHRPFIPIQSGFYAVKTGGTNITIGVVGNQLVGGRATPAQLRAFAAAQTTAVAGAQGSLTFRIALVDLIRLALHQRLPSFVQPILSSLGDLTGWAGVNSEALTGAATLAVK
jgi:hypothetical protein